MIPKYSSLKSNLTSVLRGFWRTGSTDCTTAITRSATLRASTATHSAAAQYWPDCCGCHRCRPQRGQRGRAGRPRPGPVGPAQLLGLPARFPPLPLLQPPQAPDVALLAEGPGRVGQCQVLATCVVARDRALPGPGRPQVLPWGFRLCPAEVAAPVGEGRISVRNQAQGQRGAGAEDSPLAPPSCRPPVAQAEGLLPQLPLSGRVLEPGPAGGGQGGVARGRVIPPHRLHCDQPDMALEGGCPLLQPAGHGGAVD